MRVINPAYNETNETKEEFCRRWIREGGYQAAYDDMFRIAKEQWQTVQYLTDREFELQKQNNLLKNELEGKNNVLIAIQKQIKEVI